MYYVFIYFNLVNVIKNKTFLKSFAHVHIARDGTMEVVPTTTLDSRSYYK